MRWPVILGGVLCVICGCEEQVVNTRWGKFSAVPEQAEPVRTGAASLIKSGDAMDSMDVTWTISLETLTGPDHRGDAERRRSELAAASGLKDLWTFDKGLRSDVYYGRYKDPEGEAAQADLQRWRQWHKQGVVRSPGVVLIPAHIAGADPRYELSQTWPNPKAFYTFEIGSYDPQFGKDFRRAAEKAAADLRGRGLEGYYHHKPEQSLISIGAYPRSVLRAVPKPNQTIEQRIIDPRLLVLTREFPQYTYNGRPLTAPAAQPGGGEVIQPVPTRLAEIER